MTNIQIAIQALFEAISFVLFLILLFGGTYLLSETFRKLRIMIKIKKLAPKRTSNTYKKCA